MARKQQPYMLSSPSLRYPEGNEIAHGFAVNNLGTLYAPPRVLIALAEDIAASG